MLYTAKGTAARLVPLSAYLQASQGWVAVFRVASGANLLAALLAPLVLKWIGAGGTRDVAAAQQGLAPATAG